MKNQPPAPPTADSILFGSDTTERIVSVEPVGKDLYVYRRMADDTLKLDLQPLKLWICLLEPERELGEATELQGGDYRFLYTFDNLDSYHDARRRFNHSRSAMLGYANPVKSALSLTGQTLFKGMAFENIIRMQLDIETTSLTPDGPLDRILLVAISDNRGFVDTFAGTEQEIIKATVACIHERNPDVIEGHNILGFDFPFLIARAKRLDLKFGIGRDHSAPNLGMERNFAIGGSNRPFRPISIHGRHVIDTLLALQRYDWARGELSSYGLKEAARVYGISETDRIELDRTRMEEFMFDDPDRVKEYARQDVVETGRLSEIVTPTEFFQTQMAPDNYAGVAITGSGEKINSIFVRAYLNAGCGIPRPVPPASNLGGHTELRMAGVINRVVKADVESLYPSIMLAERIQPASDHLGVFLPALEQLTRRRLEAKGMMKTCPPDEVRYWDGLQSSFKVLINSFYGYLGANPFQFNDPAAAGRITELGRKLVVQIADEITERGGKVIEIDTDGVYFQSPVGIDSEESQKEFVTEVGSKLPLGIRLAFDGRYKTMISVKTKNYVLYGYDGEATFKGASLRSRAEEMYGREFMRQVCDLLVEGRESEASELYLKLLTDLLERHRLGLALAAGASGPSGEDIPSRTSDHKDPCQHGQGAQQGHCRRATGWRVHDRL
ncbi:MAG: DNA polymerase domain-containing protein [Chthonomonadales bacterium]